MNPAYKEKLQNPRWQRRRLEIMHRADFKCEACGSGDRQLEIHHRRYEQEREPWEYPDDELKCVCCDCHEAHHIPEESLTAALEEKLGLTRARELRVKIDAELKRRRVGPCAMQDVLACLEEHSGACPAGGFEAWLKLRREIETVLKQRQIQAEEYATKVKKFIYPEGK